MKSVVINFPLERRLQSFQSVNAKEFSIEFQRELFRKPVVMEKGNKRIGFFIVDSLQDAISTITLNKTNYFSDQRTVRSFFENGWNRNKWIMFLNEQKVIFSSYEEFPWLISKGQNDCTICLLVDNAESFEVSSNSLMQKKAM